MYLWFYKSPIKLIGTINAIPIKIVINFKYRYNM
ncbi:hypothetical protein MALU111345_18125 [Marinicrinis lubricantis]